MTVLIRYPIVVVLILATVGCQRNRPSASNADPATQSNSGQPINNAAPLATPEKPALSCQVENVSLYPVPNNPENLALSVIVSVQNSGASTTVQDWKLTMQAVNHADYGSVDAVHVNGVVEMPGKTGGRVDLGKEDLVLKTKQNPIAKAASLKGVLTFVLPKTSVQDVSNNQSSFVIHFKDNQDVLYRSRKTLLGMKRTE